MISMGGLRTLICVISLIISAVVICVMVVLDYYVAQDQVANLDIIYQSESYMDPIGLFSIAASQPRGYVPIVASMALDSLNIELINQDSSAFMLTSVIAQYLGKTMTERRQDLDFAEEVSDIVAAVTRGTPEVRKSTSMASFTHHQGVNEIPATGPMVYKRPANYTYLSRSGFGILDVNKSYLVTHLVAPIREVKKYRNGDFATDSRCDFKAAFTDPAVLADKLDACKPPWLRAVPEVVDDEATITSVFGQLPDSTPDPALACLDDTTGWLCGDPPPKPRCWRTEGPPFPDQVEKPYVASQHAYRAFKSPGPNPTVWIGAAQEVLQYNGRQLQSTVILPADHPSRVPMDAPVGASCAAPPCIPAFPQEGAYLDFDDQWGTVSISTYDARRREKLRDARTLVYGRDASHAFHHHMAMVVNMDFGRAPIDSVYGSALNRSYDELTAIQAASIDSPISVTRPVRYGECSASGTIKGRPSAATIHGLPCLLHEAYRAAHLGADILSPESTSVPSTGQMRGTYLYYIPASSILGTISGDLRTTTPTRVHIDAQALSTDGAVLIDKAAPLDDTRFQELVEPFLRNTTSDIYRQLAVLQPSILPHDMNVRGHSGHQQPLHDFYVEFLVNIRATPGQARHISTRDMFRTIKTTYPSFHRGKQPRGSPAHVATVALSPVSLFLEDVLNSLHTSRDRSNAVNAHRVSERDKMHDRATLYMWIIFLVVLFIVIFTRTVFVCVLASALRTIVHYMRYLLVAMGHIERTEWDEAAILLPPPTEELFPTTGAQLEYGPDASYIMSEMNLLVRGLAAGVSTMNALSVYLPSYVKVARSDKEQSTLMSDSSGRRSGAKHTRNSASRTSALTGSIMGDSSVSGSGYGVLGSVPQKIKVKSRGSTGDRAGGAMETYPSVLVGTEMGSVRSSTSHLPETVEDLPRSSQEAFAARLGIMPDSSADWREYGSPKLSTGPSMKSVTTSDTMRQNSSKNPIRLHGSAMRIGNDNARRNIGVVCVITRQDDGGTLGGRNSALNTLLTAVEPLVGSRGLITPCAYSRTAMVFVSIGVTHDSVSVLGDTLMLAWSLYGAMRGIADVGLCVTRVAVGRVGKANLFTVPISTAFWRARAAALHAGVILAPSAVVDSTTVDTTSMEGQIRGDFVVLPCGQLAGDSSQMGLLGRVPASLTAQDIAAAGIIGPVADALRALWRPTPIPASEASAALSVCGPLLAHESHVTGAYDWDHGTARLVDPASPLSPSSRTLTADVVQRIASYVAGSSKVRITSISMTNPALGERAAHTLDLLIAAIPATPHRGSVASGSAAQHTINSNGSFIHPSRDVQSVTSGSMSSPMLQPVPHRSASINSGTRMSPQLPRTFSSR